MDREYYWQQDGQMGNKEVNYIQIKKFHGRDHSEEPSRDEKIMLQQAWNKLRWQLNFIS
jgi:hypothetical protein